VRCAGCGATLRPDASWCGQCHGDPAPVAVAVEEPQAWRPLPAVERERLSPTYTRTGSTVTTFGLFGRSLLTFVWFDLIWWFLHTSPLSAAMFALFTPWWLRAVWKRARQT
jgi:hypothetical protein